MKRSELENTLRDWAIHNQDELGYIEEFRVTVDAHDDYVNVEVSEAEEGHVLAGANGKTLEDACEEVAKRITQALDDWGWPTEFPVKEVNY